MEETMNEELVLKNKRGADGEKAFPGAAGGDGRRVQKYDQFH